MSALHRWLNQNGGEPFAGRPLPARQSTEVLMDRYRSHTLNCRSCSQALERIRQIRPWLWGGLWGSAAMVGSDSLSWTGLGLAALTGLALIQTARWQQGLTTGNGQAPRNQIVRSTALKRDAVAP